MFQEFESAMISASRQIIASRVCFRWGFSPRRVFSTRPRLAPTPFIWKIEVYHFTSRRSAGFLNYFVQARDSVCCVCCGRAPAHTCVICSYSQQCARWNILLNLFLCALSLSLHLSALFPGNEIAQCMRARTSNRNFLIWKMPQHI
jgi:hypothetical protein